MKEISLGSAFILTIRTVCYQGGQPYLTGWKYALGQCVYRINVNSIV